MSIAVDVFLTPFEQVRAGPVVALYMAKMRLAACEGRTKRGRAARQKMKDVERAVNTLSEVCYTEGTELRTTP